MMYVTVKTKSEPGYSTVIKNVATVLLDGMGRLIVNTHDKRTFVYAPDEWVSYSKQQEPADADPRITVEND